MATSYCFLSTYPPTQCGLATFTAALRRELLESGLADQVNVVRLVDSNVRSVKPEVIHHLAADDRAGCLTAAAALNSHDVAIIQHDYDIYGGTDGDSVLAVLAELRVPSIVVLHSVLAAPTPQQRSVLERLISAADAVVVLSETARDRLVGGYAVEAAKLSVIPHGAAENSPSYGTIPPRSPMILTWGLLGPGKGIEWALIGLHEIRRMHPAPKYVVAGQTHPRVRERQGEAYRLGLATRARALGVSELLRFERGYLDEATLSRLIDRADVVLLPYDSNEQVTSGVLIEAVAAHKPVVSTAFPHAVEVLSSGAGLLVPHRNGPAIGVALRRVLTEPGLAAGMVAEAARIAPAMYWPAVAERYRDLAAQLLSTRATVT